MKKKCKKHGKTEFLCEKNGRLRCKKCRVEATSSSRRRKKEKLVEMLGGKCIVCGYDLCIEALDLHHLDPKKKEFSISKHMSKGIDTLLKEAKKCVVVCCRCHREIECGAIVL